MFKTYLAPMLPPATCRCNLKVLNTELAKIARAVENVFQIKTL